MSTFLCLICEEQFTRDKRIPRRLECSCVCCEQCLKVFTKLSKSYKCEIHNQKSSKLIEDLEVVEEYLRDEVGNAIRQSQFCQNHMDMYKFYCQDDNEKVCGACTISSHNGHKFISLEQKFQEANSQIVNELRDLEDQMNLEQKIKAFKPYQQALGRKALELREQTLRLQAYFYRQIHEISLLELKSQLQELYRFQQDITNKIVQSKSMLKKLDSLRQKENTSLEGCQQISQEIKRLQKEYEQINANNEGENGLINFQDSSSSQFKNIVMKQFIKMNQIEETQAEDQEMKENKNYEYLINQLNQQLDNANTQNIKLNEQLQNANKITEQLFSTLRELEKAKTDLTQQVKQLTEINEKNKLKQLQFLPEMDSEQDIESEYQNYSQNSQEQVQNYVEMPYDQQTIKSRSQHQKQE